MNKKREITVLFSLFVVVAIAMTSSEVIYQLVIQRIVDEGVLGNREKLFSLIIVLGALGFINVICSFIWPLIEERYRNALVETYRAKILKGITRQSFEHLSVERRAKYVSVLNNDVVMVVDEYYIVGLDVIQCVLSIVFSVVALFTLHWSMACFVILGGVLLGCNPLIFKKGFESRKKEISISLKQYNHRLADFMTGIHVVKAYLYEEVARMKVDEASKHVNKARYIYRKITAWANILGVLINECQNFFIIVFGVYLISKGEMSTGQLLATLQISWVIAQPITMLVYRINIRQSVKPIKKEIDMLLNKENNAEKYCTNEISDIECLEVQQVSYQKDEKEILKEINLIFEKNRKYLVLGSSGSGKSTLIKLLYRMLDGYSGEIMVNGYNVREVDKKAYYKQIAMVFQDPTLFDMSLEDNLLLGKEVKKDVVDSLINIFGLDKLRDCKVSNLSGGEKQRVALGRAVLHQPQILFLDEVTSSLDLETSRRIEQLVLSMPQMIISITHKPSVDTLAQYDKIILIRDGEIIKCGVYDEIKDNDYVKEIIAS